MTRKKFIQIIIACLAGMPLASCLFGRKEEEDVFQVGHIIEDVKVSEYVYKMTLVGDDDACIPIIKTYSNDFLSCKVELDHERLAKWNAMFSCYNNGRIK